eukprot:6207006-Pleurochrysis_carterae.AAC.2
MSEHWPPAVPHMSSHWGTIFGANADPVRTKPQPLVARNRRYARPDQLYTLHVAVVGWTSRSNTCAVFVVFECVYLVHLTMHVLK